MNNETVNQTNSDKRQQTRVDVNDEICVRDTTSGLEMGTIANIHEEGFMVISDGGLKEDHLYQVVLERSQADNILMGAECLWLSETGTGDQIWAGFQVMDISEEAKSHLDELVSLYEE